ncbi:MAG TPA: CvpA family protein [Fibrobacteraceae bacterium]|nr:CvpA family protein [Fibrobacteraceae bacterium]
MPQLNPLDWTCLGIVVLFVALGTWKGLIRSLFQIASWIAGTAGAYFSWWHLSPLLLSNLGGIHPVGLRIFSAFVGFVLCFLVVALIGRTLHTLVSKSPLGGVNRWGGALVGLLKSLLLISLLLLVLELLPVQGELANLRDHSFCYRFWLGLHGFLPAPLQTLLAT